MSNKTPAKPLVSILMITYNHEKFISQALESILMQEVNFNYEVIIGDDASTDNTKEILKSYKKIYPYKIHLTLHKTNIGVMPNFSYILNLCKGKYIALLEGDDYWIDEKKLQKQVEIMEANTSYSMCFSDRIIVDESGNIINKTGIPENKKKILTKENIIGSFTPPTQTVLLKRNHLNSKVLEWLKYVYNGDTFLFSFLSTKGDVGYINETTAAYRIHSKGYHSSENYINRLEKRLTTNRYLIKLMQCKKDRQLLLKRQLIILQRLYVHYFIQKRILLFIKTLLLLIMNDVVFLTIHSLKANKLLFLVLTKKKEILD